MMSRDCRSAERLGVLVVEPRELVAARLKAQLERLCHLAYGRARDGEEAIAAAQRLHPSLVLMETALPGLDGVSTARVIVTERPVPVILLTDIAGEEDDGHRPLGDDHPCRADAVEPGERGLHENEARVEPLGRCDRLLPVPCASVGEMAEPL